MHSASVQSESTEIRATGHFLNVRIPSHLLEALRVAAQRDGNGLSATTRRLLMAALRGEQGGAER